MEYFVASWLLNNVLLELIAFSSGSSCKENRAIKSIGFRVRQTLVQNLALPLTCYATLASHLTCLSLFLSVKLNNRGRHSMNATTGEMLLITIRKGAVESLILDGAVQSKVCPGIFCLSREGDSPPIYPGLVFLI